MKKLLSLFLAGAMSLSLAACGRQNSPAPTAPRVNTIVDASSHSNTIADASSHSNTTVPGNPVDTVPETLSYAQEVIRMAQDMTLEELAAKAISESDGKCFVGLGASAQAENAMSKFVEYLKTFNSTYSVEWEWQQPKNGNTIAQLAANSPKSIGDFGVALVSDGSRIQSQLVEHNVVSTFVPKLWAQDNGTTADDHTDFLPLRSVAKVFEYKSVIPKTFNSCWDFVAEGEHGYCTDISVDTVGRNFLMMLTREDYAAMIRESFESMTPEKQEPYLELLQEMQDEAAQIGLNEDGAYALAWIKLWVESYQSQKSDEDIFNTLTGAFAGNPFGVLDYSTLRVLGQYNTYALNNIKVVAFEPAYHGIGGFGYNEYLFIPNNSPTPWTACAFIAYITCTVDGFSSWGNDMGSYSCNPRIAREIEEIYHHSAAGTNEQGVVQFAIKNDPGIAWWNTQGSLVVEDPEYCAGVDFTIGSWIDILTRYDPAAAVTTWW